MLARSSAFLLWALVAAAALFWGFKLFAKPLPVPAQAVLATSAGLAPADLSRVLGVDPPPPVAELAPPPPEASRFQLLGVVAPRAAGASSEGLALISVDQKPPRAYRVGAVIDGGTVLQSVRQRGVSLGPRGAAPLVSLDMPPPAPAATGTLPTAAAPVNSWPTPAQSIPQPGGVQAQPQFPQFPQAPAGVGPAPGLPQPGAFGVPGTMPPGNRPNNVR